MKDNRSTPVRSEPWLDVAPPTTPDSEGWWWVRRVPQSTWERDNPRVALLKMDPDGNLIASIWRWSGEYDVRTMEHWRWGGRIAVPGASSIDGTHRPPAKDSQKAGTVLPGGSMQ